MVRLSVWEDNTFRNLHRRHHCAGARQWVETSSHRIFPHELKTPVGSIMGYMESISNLTSTCARSFFVAGVGMQAKRLTALLQDISTLNKIDEGKRLFQKEPCDLAQVINDVVRCAFADWTKAWNVLFSVTTTLCCHYRKIVSLLYSNFQEPYRQRHHLHGGGEQIVIDISCYREDEQFYYFFFPTMGGIAETFAKYLNVLPCW